MKCNLKFTELTGDFSSSPAITISDVDEVIVVRAGMPVRVFAKPDVWHPISAPSLPDASTLAAFELHVGQWWKEFVLRGETAINAFHAKTMLRDAPRVSAPTPRPQQDDDEDDDDEPQAHNAPAPEPEEEEMTLEQARELCDARGIPYARNAGLAALQAKLAVGVDNYPNL